MMFECRFCLLQGTPISTYTKIETNNSNNDEINLGSGILRNMLLRSPITSFPLGQLGYAIPGKGKMMAMSRKVLKCDVVNSMLKRCRLEVAMMPVSQ